jgi:hypothetical protein
MLKYYDWNVFDFVILSNIPFDILSPVIYRLISVLYQDLIENGVLSNHLMTERMIQFIFTLKFEVVKYLSKEPIESFIIFSHSSKQQKRIAVFDS